MIKNSIARTTKRFTLTNMAEIFFMERNGDNKNDFFRGEVAVEKVGRTITVWRWDYNHNEYRSEFESKDFNEIAKHLYAIDEHEYLGWDVPFETAVKVWEVYEREAV